MRKIIPLLFLLGCSLSHNAARELKYTGIVLGVGGALVVTAPTLNGDGLQPHTTEAGVTLVLAALALGVAGVVLDPANADATR